MKDNEVKVIERDHIQEFPQNCENLKPEIQKALQKSKQENYKENTPIYVIVKSVKTKHQTIKPKKQPEKKTPFK